MLGSSPAAAPIGWGDHVTLPDTPFDRAMALKSVSPGLWRGGAPAAYWNRLGPFGGWTAAILLQAVMEEPDRRGDPLALHVQFIGPIEDGPVTLATRLLRANRSTQFWRVEMRQETPTGQAGASVVAFGVATLGVRRASAGFLDVTMPLSAPPEGLTPRPPPAEGPAFFRTFDWRVAAGGFPPPPGDSRMAAWVRDAAGRPLDPVLLAAICDIPPPSIMMHQMTPASSIAMTVHLVAPAAEITAVGSDFVLVESAGARGEQGLADQTARVWRRDGALLATTSQIVWYR